MNGLNKVFLIGYLGAAPEVQHAVNGSPYTRLNLATHRSRKTETGEWETFTDWHRVMVWGKTAENCATHLRKGSAVAIEGYLSHYKSQENEGTPLTQTSVVAEDVQFLPGVKPAPGRALEAIS